MQKASRAPTGKISGAALLVSSGTVASRLTGLLRDVIVFTWLGISPSMDALVLAMRIPGTFYRYVVDAGFIRLLVPRLIQAEDRQAYIAATFLPCLLVTTLAVALLWLVIPQLLYLLAPGFDEAQRTLAIQLIRLVVFYIPMSFVTGYLAALLYSRMHYGVPAYIQVILNLCIAAGTAGLALYFEQPHQVVVMSMIAGAGLQILVLLLVVWRLQMLPALHWGVTDPQFLLLLRGLGVILLITLPQQLGMWISFALGSQVAAGAPSMLYLAERLVQLPLAIIGVAMATVVLPVLAKLHRDGKVREFAGTMDWGLQTVTALALPAAAGMWMICDQLLVLLFAWREMDELAMHGIAQITRAMLLAVPFSILAQVLSAGYFSRQNYGSIVSSSLVGTVVLSLSAWYLALALGYGGVGIGLGNSLGALAAIVVLMGIAAREQYWTPALGRWLVFLLRILLACAVMVVCLWQIERMLAPWLPLLPLMLLEILLGSGCYFVALYGLGLPLKNLYSPPDIQPSAY